MRKLLVLFAVLAINSVASANLIYLQISSINGEWINPVSEISIAPGDYVNLDIIYTTAGEAHIGQISCTIVLDFYDVPDGAASLDLSQLTLPPGMWDPDPTFSPGVNGDSLTYTEGMLPAPPAGGYDDDILIDHILIYCDTDDVFGIIFVTLEDFLFGGIGTMDSDWNTIGSGLDYGPGVMITYVYPEPMTLALLGLGAVMLRRKRD